MVSNEVAAASSNEVGAVNPVASFSAGIDASDIIIPKILLMQALSDLVESEKMKSGDFI